MPISKAISFICVMALALNAATAQQNLKLWYNKPAANWNEALPIGNGRLAGMVYGTPGAEQIQLNEETVWAGGPHNNVNADDKAIVPELRKLINEKKYIEAQALANEKMFSKQNGMPYQTVGSLLISFPGHDNAVGYYRDLDIAKALTTVTYTVNGVRFKRETFASFTDQAIITRLTADKPNAITCILTMQTPMVKHKVGTANNILILNGTTDSRSGIEGQVKFQAQTVALNQGGTVSANDTSVTVTLIGHPNFGNACCRLLPYGSFLLAGCNSSHCYRAKQ